MKRLKLKFSFTWALDFKKGHWSILETAKPKEGLAKSSGLGACSSKVPRFCRARKASCQTEIRLF